ncbi:MAG: undecaprenyldiphospho-muramoylpentapeptide beta-N-acetylglucosaminyltransferase [Rickettsiales bacterium]|nr:undecaprenyldiphospho-muramoylpentapeptide beta-N-acetylglucosaminyltransferase [Rickettsiales bacterium]
MQTNKIFITSGGTGGHIIPARCLAKELATQRHQVIFLGDVKYRNYIKKDDGFKHAIISSSQLEKQPVKLIRAALKIAFGILQCSFYFLKYRPKTIVAFGGYSTFPALIVAVITKRKIILHEQNSHLGKVNRIFAKYATKIALSFEETSGISDEYKSKTTFTGNPVRDEIIALNQTAYSLPQRQEITINKDNKMGYDILLASDFVEKNVSENINLFNILIIGGSGGAKIFSEILPKAFFNLNDEFKGYINIVQQCRGELVRSTYEQYKSFNLNCEIQAFFDDMPEKIKQAHLVIARAGSSSLFEFCAAKKPMVLIPFEKAADNHQEKNARLFEKYGAAIVVTEKEFTINKISEILRNLIGNSDSLTKMSNASSHLAQLNATKNLVQTTLSF